MQKKPTKLLKNLANSFFAVLIFCALILGGCSVDDKALIEKTLDAREKAMNNKDVDCIHDIGQQGLQIQTRR